MATTSAASSAVPGASTAGPTFVFGQGASGGAASFASLSAQSATADAFKVCDVVFLSFACPCPHGYRLVVLVVKASALGVEDLELDSRLCHGDFSRSSLTSSLKIGTPVASLPGSWRYRVSWDCLAWCQYTVTGRGRKFDLQLYLSVAGRTII